MCPTYFFNIAIREHETQVHSPSRRAAEAKGPWQKESRVRRSYQLTNLLLMPIQQYERSPYDEGIPVKRLELNGFSAT